LPARQPLCRSQEASFAADDPDAKARLAAFQQELERLGWSQQSNLHIEYRFAAARIDQYVPLAKELVALKPEVILAQSTQITAALKQEARGIPIVFTNVSDPIGAGFITSLARPGGNLTGVLQYEAGIVGKWLAMLKEIAPHLTRIALVGNPKTRAGALRLLPSARSSQTRCRSSDSRRKRRCRH
jgi:putative tryptophan/tyrosine transport system substrate-binding protein